MSAASTGSTGPAARAGRGRPPRSAPTVSAAQNAARARPAAATPSPRSSVRCRHRPVAVDRLGDAVEEGDRRGRASSDASAGRPRPGLPPRTSGSGRSCRSTATSSAAFARKRRNGTASQAPRARAAPASRGSSPRPTPTVAWRATTALSLRDGKSDLRVGVEGARRDAGAEAEERGAEERDAGRPSRAGHERHRRQRGLGEGHEHEAEGEGALRADAARRRSRRHRPEGGERHLAARRSIRTARPTARVLAARRRSPRRRPHQPLDEDER